MDGTFEKRKKIIYALICDDYYIPMKLKEMAALLQVPKDQRQELKDVLDSLVGEGRIRVSKKGKYCKGETQTLTGVYQANPRGFGFVTVEGREEDVFIGEDDTGGAFQGDTVEIVLTREKDSSRQTGRDSGRRHRCEGRVVKVLERGVTDLVGLYEKPKKKSYGFVIPDNRRFLEDVFIPEGKDGGAVDGHKVVVELTDYGGSGRKPEGRIREILGHVNDPGVDILSIVKGYDLPCEFPEKVMNQAERIPDHISEADMAGRKDIRDWQMVTIDGEDSKDLDDAVSLIKKGDSYILGVHIADVANYVQEGSALDREALKRGTSVYLADRVIPMLPHRLSNGICSLNEGEDRLALSCIMTIDRAGHVTDHEIAETVIRVDRRMSYTSVAKILEEEDPEETRRYKEVVPMLRQMAALSGILREKRHRRGSIDFDFPEAKLILNEKGKPVDIRPYERNTATRLIEDFMLLANETVAETYFWREAPFLYRTHGAPDEEKLRSLAIFINSFGYTMHISGKVQPMEIQKLLGRIEGTPQEALISRLALRSMQRACYAPENEGHFGLAAKYYTHFTSPIRRYPDLQIHRIIKDDLRGRLNEKKAEHYRKILPGAAKQSSQTERRAEEAERETVKLKKAEYMSDHLGETFEGVISGITKWGMYVELPSTVEGLVHVSSMHDDHYEYREDRYEMTGSHTGRTYRLGQKIRVRVAGADRLQRTIDFEIAKEEGKDHGESEDRREDDRQQQEGLS